MPEILSVTAHDEPSRSTPTALLGILGEKLATRYLTELGYRLVVSNFKVPIGRNRNNAQITGEIDIIAFDGDVLCFIEVKTRTSDAFADPITAVGLRKQRQIIRTARVYRRIFRIVDVEYRYDVVTVLRPADAAPAVEIIKGFWNEAKFAKRSWNDAARNHFD